MKNIIFVIFIAIVSNCNSQEIKFLDEEPSQNDVLIIDQTIGNEKNLVTFTENYDDDFVSVNINSKRIFSDSISTDANFGAARGIEVDRNCNSIIIGVNKKKLIIKNYPEYRFIYIKKDEDEYYIDYRKKPIKFN